MLNAHFLLTLSALADTYSQFGVVVNIAQMVHLLPHKRYELFVEAVEHFEKMKQCLTDHTKCNSLAPEGRGQRCLWPLNHGDKSSLRGKNEIGEIPIILQHAIQAAGLQSETRRQTTIMIDNNMHDAEAKSDEQILSLLVEIHGGLKLDVYD